MACLFIVAFSFAQNPKQIKQIKYLDKDGEVSYTDHFNKKGQLIEGVYKEYKREYFYRNDTLIHTKYTDTEVEAKGTGEFDDGYTY